MQCSYDSSISSQWKWHQWIEKPIWCNFDEDEKPTWHAFFEYYLVLPLVSLVDQKGHYGPTGEEEQDYKFNTFIFLYASLNFAW